MDTRPRRVGAGLAISVALVVFVAAADGLVVWTEGSARDSAPAVAVVNGTAITADDLDLRLSQILPMVSYHGRLPADRLIALKRAALDELVLDELIVRDAMADGRRPSSEAVDAEISTVRARFASDEEFASALSDNGLDEASFRRRIGRAVLVQETRAARALVDVPEADVASYYRENRAKFQRPEQVRLRQILFRVDPADPATAAPAEAKARAALVSLRRGRPFGELARRLSEDEYRVKDGDMGLVHRGRLDREFEDAVFAAPVGQARLARSLYGFEVFEVLERQPPETLTLDQARPIIVARLERQRRTERLRDWKARLLAGAHIEIRDGTLLAAKPAELPEDEPMRPSGVAGAGR